MRAALSNLVIAAGPHLSEVLPQVLIVCALAGVAFAALILAILWRD